MTARNLAVRSAVAAVAIPLLVLLLLHGGVPLFAFVELVIVLCLWEFINLTSIRLHLSQKLVFLLLALFPAFSFMYLEGEYLFEYAMAVIAVVTLPHVFARKLGTLSRSIGMGLFGAFYIPLGLGSIILISASGVVEPQLQGGWLVFLFTTVWLVDTAAYLLGLAFGSSKLSPEISPNKTIAGFVFGFLGAPLAALLLSLLFLTDIGFMRLLPPALAIALLGQLADLIESIFKREAGRKDSSDLIPGHGGALDRFDSILLAAPTLYLYLRYLY
jgi:phosphatidate cytidylyltransferase